MSVSIQTVVSQLSDTGLVAPVKLDRFLPPQAYPKDAEELLASLVEKKQLTVYQAERIKAGKGNELVLGGYTLLDRLGGGGMGQVFKAEHRRMKRVVAVKTLPPGLMKDSVAVARFEREVEAAAKLEHPNIVTAYDADRAGDIHFLVMQFVDGSDLSALVKKNGPLAVVQAVDYILQAARGLAFAHGKGVVHRDIKPANLLLGKDGVVRILDMGLARIEADAEANTQAELTDTGAVMGTVDFMAPDQALDIRHADARADIYSLGCSLYYLVAGKPMYGGESAIAKLLAHRERPIPSLKDVQAGVPKQLDTVFKKMVAKHVADRYQSMAEVTEALEELGLRAEVGVHVEREFTVAHSANERRRSKTAEVAATDKTKHLAAKILGGVFAMIVAPLLVTYIVKYSETTPPPPKKTDAGAGASIVAASTQDASSKPIWAGWPSDAPAPAIAPFGADLAKKHQDAWAKHVGVPVEFTNSLGMTFRLIPPGEFVMGTSPEELAPLLDDAKKTFHGWLNRFEVNRPHTLPPFVSLFILELPRSLTTSSLHLRMPPNIGPPMSGTHWAAMPTRCANRRMFGASSPRRLGAITRWPT